MTVVSAAAAVGVAHAHLAAVADGSGVAVVDAPGKAGEVACVSPQAEDVDVAVEPPGEAVVGLEDHASSEAGAAAEAIAGARSATRPSNFQERSRDCCSASRPSRQMRQADIPRQRRNWD